MSKGKVYVIGFNGVLDQVSEYYSETGQLTDNYHEADCFVLWQDIRGECVELARIIKEQLGKPLVVMQHGRGATRDYCPPNKLPMLADLMLVWGEAEKKRLLSAGVPEHRIEVVGCPLFSYLKPKVKREGLNILYAPVIAAKEEPENILVYAELKKWESERLIRRIERDFDKMKQAWAYQANELKEVVLPDGTKETRLWKSEVRPVLPRNISYMDGLINAKLTGIHDLHQYQCPVVVSSQDDPAHARNVCELLRNVDALVCLEEGTMQLLAHAMDIPVIVVDIFKYGNYGGVSNYDTVEKIKTDACYWVNTASKVGAALDRALAHPAEKRSQRIAVCENEGGAHLDRDLAIKAIDRFLEPAIA